MRTLVSVVALAVAVAGCTAQPAPPPPPYYPAGYPPPPPGYVYAPPPPPRPSNALGNACGELGWGKVAGAMLGGAAGGAIVSNVARGRGSGVATAAGVIGGLLLGGLAGSSIDKVNCEHARAAQAQALQPTAPIGQPVPWADPQSGARGTFTPTKESRQPDGVYCREYNQTIVIDGKQEQGVGRACQQPDGSWKTVG